MSKRLRLVLAAASLTILAITPLRGQTEADCDEAAFNACMNAAEAAYNSCISGGGDPVFCLSIKMDSIETCFPYMCFPNPEIPEA